MTPDLPDAGYVIDATGIPDETMIDERNGLGSRRL
jgi:hypothetical protein